MDCPDHILRYIKIYIKIKRPKRAFFSFTPHELPFERISFIEGGMPNANYHFQTSIVA